MSWIRDLFSSHRTRPQAGETSPAPPAAGRSDASDGRRPRPAPVSPPTRSVRVPLTCPSCGVPLDPPPARDRSCPRCRQPIVVRHVEGRTVLLTREAVVVFEAERRRAADEAAWRRERDDWLQLARDRGVEQDRRAKLAGLPISADVVRRARDLALAASRREAKAAAREKRWGQLGQIQRDEAAALYRAAGSPMPPPAEILAIHREGMLAVLRSLRTSVRDAELVGRGCCPACRVDDGESFSIADELRLGRLPHDGCPRGLCPCDWWPAPDRPKRRRRRRAAVRSRPDPGSSPAGEP